MVDSPRVGLDGKLYNGHARRSICLYVLIQQIRELIQQQTLDIDLPQPLFQSPGTVCDDVDNLCDKGLVRGDLIVPCLHEVT